jgi:dolichol-phosphate mannosyltransferase
VRSLIVIPTYNEKENIQPIVDSILSVTTHEVDILVVDDGSPDGTGEIADRLAQSNSRVHVLHRTKKMGLGTAYVNGFKWGLAQVHPQTHPSVPIYDQFIEMDADFSHHPRYLEKMLESLRTSDVVIGSRYVPGGGTLNWGWGRKILSRGGSIYSRFILGAPIRDFTGGFNGWRRQVLERVDLDTLRSDGYSFQIELKYRAFLQGFKVSEFPILFEDRKVGFSKMNRRIVFEALMRVWEFRCRTQRLLT